MNSRNVPLSDDQNRVADGMGTTASRIATASIEWQNLGHLPTASFPPL